MWEQICETLSEWGRWYVSWGYNFVEDVGPASYGYALLTVAGLGWLLMKGKNSYSS